MLFRPVKDDRANIIINMIKAMGNNITPEMVIEMFAHEMIDTHTAKEVLKEIPESIKACAYENLVSNWKNYGYARTEDYQRLAYFHIYTFGSEDSTPIERLAKALYSKTEANPSFGTVFSIMEADQVWYNDFFADMMVNPFASRDHIYLVMERVRRHALGEALATSFKLADPTRQLEVLESLCKIHKDIYYSNQKMVLLEQIGKMFDANPDLYLTDNAVNMAFGILADGLFGSERIYASGIRAITGLRNSESGKKFGEYLEMIHHFFIPTKLKKHNPVGYNLFKLMDPQMEDFGKRKQAIITYIKSNWK